MAVVNRTRREKKKKKEEDGSREEESANDIKDDIRIQDSSLHEEGQSLYEQLESVRRWNPEEEVKEEEREASGKKQKEEEEASLRLRSQSSFSCLRSDAEEKEQEEDLLLFDFPLHHFLPSNSSSLCCYEPPASSSSFLSLVHNQAEETREERNCPPTTTTTPSPLEKDVFLSHPCLTLSMVSSPCKKDNIYDIHHRNTSSSPPQTFPVDFSYSSCSSSSSPRRICISADLHLSSSRKKRFDKEKENKDKNQERKEGEEETTRKKTMHLESSRVSSFPRTFHATATISHRGQDRQIKDGEDLHPSHRDRLSNLFNQTCERNLSLSSSSFFFLSSQPVFGKERQQQEEEKEGEGQEESRQVDVNRFFVFSSSSSVSEQEHESHKEEEEVGHASRRNKEIILSSSYDRGEMNCIESSSISLHLRREQYERGRREGEGRRTRRTRERRRRDSTVFTRAPCHSLHHHYHYKQRPLLLPHPLKYPSRQSSGWSDDDEEKKEEEEKELHVDTDEMMGDGEKKENRKEQSLQSHKISSSCPADTPSSLVLWCKVKHDEKASQTPTSCLSKEKNASFASSAPLPSSLSPSSRFKKKHSSHHKHASHPTSSSAGTTTERERSRSRGEKDTSMLREKERNEEEEGGLVSLDKSRGSIKTGKEEKEEEEGSSGCACSSSLNCRVEEGISPSKDERRTFRRKKISSSKHVCVSAVSYSSSPTSLSFFPRDEKIDRNNSYSREHEEEEKEHNGDDDDDGVAILSWCESLSVSSSENLSPLRLHHRPQLYCVCCGRKGFPEEEGEEEILASRQVKEEEKARENGPDDANLEEPFHRRRKRSPRNLECSSSATQEVDEGEKDRSFVARGGEEEQRQNEVKGTIPYEKKKKHQEQQQEEEESTDVKRKTSSTRFTCPSHQNHSSLNAPSSSIASFEGDREKRPLLLTSSQQDEIEETSCSKDVKTKDSHEAEIHPGHDERAENRKHRGGKAKEMLYRRFFSENDKDMRGCRGQGGAGSSSSSSSSCCSRLLPSRLCLSEDDRFFESSKGEREKFSSSCLEKENGQKDAVILCSPHESPSSHVENSSISALKREIGEGRTKSWEKDDRKDPRKSRDRVERRFCIGEAFSSGGKEREEMMKTKASRAGERLASSFHDERGTEEICWREQEEKEALSGEERERREEEKEELEGTTVVRNPDDEDDGRTEGIEDGEKTKEEERERERGTRKIESKDGCKFIEDPESFRWKREARRKVKDDGMRSSSADSLRGDLREKRKMPRVFSSSSSTTGRGYRHRRRFLSHSSTSPPDLLRGRRWREKERRDDMKREVSVPSFFHQRERIDLSLRERQENSPGLRRLLPVRESLEMCEDFLRQLDDEEKEDEFERTKLLSTLLGASPSGVRTPEEMAAYTPKEAVLSPSRLARTSSAGMNLEGHLHAGVLSEEKRMEEKEKDEERRGSIIDLSHESLSSFSPPLLIKTSSKYGFSPYQRNNSMGAHNLPRDGTLLSHNTRDLLQSDESHEASTRTFPGVYTHLDNNDNVDLHHLHRFSSAPSSSLPQTDKGEAFHSYNSSRHKVTSLMSSLDKSLDAISTERREDSERRKNSLSNPIQQISSSSLSSAVPPLSATAHPFSQLFLPRPSDMITHSMNEERERNFSSFIDQPFRDSKREVAKEVEEGDMRRSLPGQGEQAEREGHLFNPYLSMSNSNQSLLLPSSSCLHQTMFSHPSLLLPASSSFAHETVRPPSSLEIAAERSLPQLQANPPGDLSEAERIKDVSFPSEERECSLQRASSFSSSCYHAYASPSKGRDEEKEKEREREEKSLLQMNTKTDITGLRGKSDERVVCVAGLENEENAVKGLPLTPFAANHVKEEEGEKEKTNKKKDCRGLVSSTSICMYDVVSHEKEENGASLDLRKEKEGKEAEEEKEEENEWSRGDKHVNENLRELVLQRKTNELRIELQAIDEQQRRKQYIKEMRYTEETRRCQKSLRDLRGKYRRLIRDFVYNLNLLKERDATIEKVEKEVVLMIQEEKRKYQVLLKEKETKAVEVLSLYESRIQDLRNRCRSSVRTLQEKMKSDLQSLEMTMEKKCLERQEETERKVRKIEEKKQKILLAQAEQNARRNLHDMTRKLQTLQEKVEVQAKEIEEREKEVEGIKKKERQEVEKTISLGKELLELKKREEDAKSKVVELNNLHASLEAQISDLKQALTV
ncbi:hypothetical protein CSUI_003460 [Cystoisospora suis]|uniref:Uncharacterized protein n=1 Tax=Cystoisospora suis TaxID=483139 RepID=A0A2C6L2F1_9APIC|nr:hypothetical protein CSUI_003460 [Cystoisospora suis]